MGRLESDGCGLAPVVFAAEEDLAHGGIEHLSLAGVGEEAEAFDGTTKGLDERGRAERRHISGGRAGIRAHYTAAPRDSADTAGRRRNQNVSSTTGWRWGSMALPGTCSTDSTMTSPTESPRISPMVSARMPNIRSAMALPARRRKRASRSIHFLRGPKIC